MKEINFNPKYTISTTGEIYSTKRKISLKSTVDTSGYLRVGLWDTEEKKTKKYLVHRLVALTYIPNPLNLPQVNHIDGDRFNNDISNLEWCTAGENQKHAYRIGLKGKKSGTLNGRSILSNEDVLIIYQSLLKGCSSKELSTKFKIARSVIGGIKTKKLWKDVTKHLPDIYIEPKRVKLSEDLVHEVCLLISQGTTVKKVTELLKVVSRDQVIDIKRKRCFKYISDNYF